MKVLVILAQRKCSYPGEYAPECMECMSEYHYEENPEYLDKKLIEHRNSGEFESVAIATLEVPNDSIEQVLFPQKGVIPATLSKTK